MHGHRRDSGQGYSGWFDGHLAQGLVRLWGRNWVVFDQQDVFSGLSGNRTTGSVEGKI